MNWIFRLFYSQLETLDWSRYDLTFSAESAEALALSLPNTGRLKWRKKMKSTRAITIWEYG